MNVEQEIEDYLNRWVKESPPYEHLLGLMAKSDPLSDRLSQKLLYFTLCLKLDPLATQRVFDLGAQPLRAMLGLQRFVKRVTKEELKTEQERKDWLECVKVVMRNTPSGVAPWRNYTLLQYLMLCDVEIDHRVTVELIKNAEAYGQELRVYDSNGEDLVDLAMDLADDLVFNALLDRKVVEPNRVLVKAMSIQNAEKMLWALKHGAVLDKNKLIEHWVASDSHLEQSQLASREVTAIFKIEIALEDPAVQGVIKVWHEFQALSQQLSEQTGLRECEDEPGESEKEVAVVMKHRL